MAWRYLFPGVAAMLVFIAFPLLYTVGIGFTNYSSANLLSEDRAAPTCWSRPEVDEPTAGRSRCTATARCASAPASGDDAPSAVRS